MLQIVDQPTFNGRSLSRRVWLQLGLAGGASLLRPLRSAQAEPQSVGFGRAKTVLFVVTGGGQSQLETWDPKPEAPARSGASSAPSKQRFLEFGLASICRRWPSCSTVAL